MTRPTSDDAALRWSQTAVAIREGDVGVETPRNRAGLYGIWGLGDFLKPTHILLYLTYNGL